LSNVNRSLTVLTVAVLLVTVSILFWSRRRIVEVFERNIEVTAARFQPFQSVLGEPTESRARFAEAESLVAAAKASPYIRDAVVTKARRAPDGATVEFPIVPYDLLARLGPEWRRELAGLRREELRVGPDLFGYIYFDLDRRAIVSLNWAIGAASIALFASLFMLLGRLYLQQSSIGRLGGELEQRRRELIRLERLARAGQLSANLLHDLKKPVLNIRHNLEELKEALGDFGGAAAAIVAGREQIDLFFQILNDSQIERFVRSDRVQEEYVDINVILDFALRLVRYERGAVEVERVAAERLPPVLAQPYQLVQVFSNLILNAYQAMEGRGGLRIETRAVEEGVEVRLADTGPGIAPEHLASVFDPFFTTKAESEGSGLGLAICRLIVQGLGGGIEVDSPPGGPTVFTVRLPAEIAAEDVGAAASERSRS
jgi:signal transduction histidine kinase